MSELRNRHFGLIATLAAVALIADLITKQIALAHFSLAEPVSTLGGFLKFTRVSNSGAAFSLGEDTTWLFSTAKLVVIIVILWISRRVRVPIWAVIFGLVVGGASGNLVDRVFRPPSPFQGEVIDWIQLPNWPVFNIADMAVVCGGALAVWASFRGINLDGSIETKPAEEEKKG
ncbi:signal peptidase II [Streptomyces sp. CA-278952]|uniref:signal peptidase II n=1 Tax=unclassified Streptomyces TaxID=2593676 RepID=UPI0022420B19|nr:MULTISPECIES: signal peptidase II [unclassified Streptomyces]UZI32663.1 signal peptidase II [Streptomyces sp. VB1]WDG32594.1 signal peptidase II [Streptomyces sp. CA-278952]